MVITNNLKLLMAGIITLFLIGIALTATIIVRVANPGAMTDKKRYEDLKVQCEKRYETETKQGVRYVSYPCSDDILQRQFFDQFHHEYVR